MKTTKQKIEEFIETDLVKDGYESAEQCINDILEGARSDMELLSDLDYILSNIDTKIALTTIGRDREIYLTVSENVPGTQMSIMYERHYETLPFENYEEVVKFIDRVGAYKLSDVKIN